MIIDSHTHYHNDAYKKPFRYLSYDKDGYALNERDRDQLFQELPDSNIPYSIEPGVSLQSCEEILQLCGEYPKRIFPAVINQIAALKGISPEEAEQATTENTIRLFQLPTTAEDKPR